MTAIQLRAELFREMSPLLDNESAMTKVIAFVKRCFKELSLWIACLNQPIRPHHCEIFRNEVFRNEKALYLQPQFLKSSNL